MTTQLCAAGRLFPAAQTAMPPRNRSRVEVLKSLLPSGPMRHGAWPLSLLLALFLVGENAHAAKVVVIGDSLSAEYDAIPDVPGTENPTAYAAITVPGWESMSWVEVLGRMRPNQFYFGGYRLALPGWLDLRFTGYEYNFAIPGFQASQYEDIVNSSLFSNPQYLLFRATLGDVVSQEAERVVIWLGANEFRANYGSLYEGSDPAPLISGLIHDLGEVIRFVQDQKPGLQTVVVNLPDLGAAPDKQQAHPDPAKRARVTQATVQANQAIAALAAAKGLAVADVFSTTERLVEGVTIWFGGVDIKPGTNPDNDPRYAFTRDGLHPNTPLQIEIARVIVEAFNRSYGAAIPRITDVEALGLLGIDPNQPYLDWIAGFGLSDAGMAGDPDGDHLVNLVEYAFGLNPGQPDMPPQRLLAAAGRILLTFKPDPSRSRHVRVVPEGSGNMIEWSELPATQIVTNLDGALSVSMPTDGPCAFLRLRVLIVPH